MMYGNRVIFWFNDEELFIVIKTPAVVSHRNRHMWVASFFVKMNRGKHAAHFKTLHMIKK